jgi:hypothetical protein
MRTALELLSDGWKALVKELGLADAIRYRALFQPGSGDYVREREELFGNLSMADWEAELARWQREHDRRPEA